MIRALQIQCIHITYRPRLPGYRECSHIRRIKSVLVLIDLRRTSTIGSSRHEVCPYSRFPHRLVSLNDYYVPPLKTHVYSRDHDMNRTPCIHRSQGQASCLPVRLGLGRVPKNVPGISSPVPFMLDSGLWRENRIHRIVRSVAGSLIISYRGLEPCPGNCGRMLADKHSGNCR
jgi:hypothetical protein